MEDISKCLKIDTPFLPFIKPEKLTIDKDYRITNIKKDQTKEHKKDYIMYTLDDKCILSVYGKKYTSGLTKDKIKVLTQYINNEGSLFIKLKEFKTYPVNDTEYKYPVYEFSSS